MARLARVQQYENNEKFRQLSSNLEEAERKQKAHKKQTSNMDRKLQASKTNTQKLEHDLQTKSLQLERLHEEKKQQEIKIRELSQKLQTEQQAEDQRKKQSTINKLRLFGASIKKASSQNIDSAQQTIIAGAMRFLSKSKKNTPPPPETVPLPPDLDDADGIGDELNSNSATVSLPEQNPQQQEFLKFRSESKEKRSTQPFWKRNDS